MKKEIINLINSENETLKINNFCYLHRWTKSVLGEAVDHLEAVFSIQTSSSFTVEIKAREWKEVVEEVQKAQKAAFENAYEELNKQLANGYIG